MQVRTINGRQCTDFAGAAELGQRSEISVRKLAADRDTSGFPQPVREPGTTAHARAKQFFALDDLRTFFAAYDAHIQATTSARVTRVKLSGDPEELLDGKQIAQALAIDYDTWRSWVRDALPAWSAGRDAYIPRPDEETPDTGRIGRRWRRATIQTFVNERGTTPAGRTAGGSVTLDDMRAVDPNSDRPLADVIADLEQRLGRPVSRQTVARRRRDLRNSNS